MSLGRKKHTARPGLEPRTSCTPCNTLTIELPSHTVDLWHSVKKITAIRDIKSAWARQNQQNDLSIQRTLRSAWASAKSDQSRHSPSLIRLGGYPSWSESSLGSKGHFVGFIMLQSNTANSYLCVTMRILHFRRDVRREQEVKCDGHEG